VSEDGDSGSGNAGGEGAGSEDLTHVEDGDVRMVDVGDKPDTARRAVATGTIHLQPSTVAAVRENEVEKGDVLATARIGAVQAVKHTWESIPMCHSIPITNVETDFELGEDRIDCRVAVETTGKTGCEMEALEGVTTGLNVVWDMVKSAEKVDVDPGEGDGAEGSREGAPTASEYPDTRIDGVRVVSKEKRPL
jgi:cyclic pyranopterin phosphate synthase